MQQLINLMSHLLQVLQQQQFHNSNNLSVSTSTTHHFCSQTAKTFAML
jgi:hypothetical protein